MISTFVTGCCSARNFSARSAGGQLEQPSDVNSSTMTGILVLLSADFDDEFAIAWSFPGLV
jgi:hypothetical protein